MQLSDKTVHQLVRAIARSSPPLFYLVIVGCVSMAALVTLEWVLLRGLVEIDRALAPSIERRAAIGAMLAFTGIVLLFEVGLFGGMGWLARRAEAGLRRSLLLRLARLPPRHFESQLPADLTVQQHQLQLVRDVVQILLRFARTVCECALLALALTWLDGLLGAITLGAALACGACAWVALAHQREADRHVHAHASRASLYHLNVLLGMTPLKMHSADRSLRREYGRVIADWRSTFRAALSAELVSDTAQSLLGWLCSALLLWRLFRAPGVHIALLLGAMCAVRLPGACQELSGLSRRVASSLAFVWNCLAPLRSDEELRGELSTATTNNGLARASIQITLAAVSVRVSGREVLHRVSCEIPAGCHVAVVGRFGSGKSSLIRLLLGCSSPETGHVLLDGEPATSDGLAALRACIAWVDPTVQLWDRSLLDNLQYGRATALDVRRLCGTASAADLLPLLEQLPAGWLTSVGDGGALLSGGEAQRVRLARAMARSGVRLALLDEAFRGLDRAARLDLLQRARARWAHQTLVCVTHDVAETLEFDKVLVIEEGQIVEQGAPHELRAQEDSRYAQMLVAEQQLIAGIWRGPQWRRVRVAEGRAHDNA